MSTEIERKFLVQGDEWRRGEKFIISQGYLNRDKERTVRVRILESAAFITVKGITTGSTRAEFEYEIPVDDAKELIKLCDGPVIEKCRYKNEYKGFVWEVDEFLGANKGLVLAEIELTSMDQTFEKPSWVWIEVTDDKRFFNSNLAISPYGTWPASGVWPPEKKEHKLNSPHFVRWEGDIYRLDLFGTIGVAVWTGTGWRAAHGGLFVSASYNGIHVEDPSLANTEKINRLLISKSDDGRVMVLAAGILPVPLIKVDGVWKTGTFSADDLKDNFERVKEDSEEAKILFQEAENSLSNSKLTNT